ncbi:hypothetical protein GQ457_04G015820 [Hibiscus cannabinus]
MIHFKTGFNLKRGEDDHISVIFTYERMPEFCYSCGQMGDPARECGFKDEMYEKTCQYGPWLRAHSSKKFTWAAVNQRINPKARDVSDSPISPGGA